MGSILPLLGVLFASTRPRLARQEQVSRPGATAPPVVAADADAAADLLARLNLQPDAYAASGKAGKKGKGQRISAQATAPSSGANAPATGYPAAAGAADAANPAAAAELLANLGLASSSYAATGKRL